MLANSACASQRPERLLADDVWMFVYKVFMCPLKHSHDWEKCIYAHDGERARRRNPSMYQAIQCPEARAKKVCPRGEECPCTHHLFEYWLHPDRYMTCLCELGAECNRPICFFAHHEAELRPLPEGLSAAPNAMGSSRRRAAAAAAASAATAAAVQSGRMPSTSAGTGQSEMGLRQLSASSLTSSNGGSQGTSLADSGTAGAYQGSSGASSSVSMLLQQQQAMVNAMAADSSHIRPGFSALSSITSPANLSAGAFSSSHAAAKVASAQQQQQMASRAAAAGSHACPVLVLEAPPPMTVSPQDSIISPQLQQAAQQFSQLNLTTAGSNWWLSPTASRAAQSNSNMSNMSLASSTSSPVSMQGVAGADGLTFPASAGNSSSALMIDPMLLGRARSVSPLSSALSSPLACIGPGINISGLGGGGGMERGGQQMQAGGLSASGVAGVHQAIMDDSPEHLSFSLWDLDTSGAPSGPPRQLLTQHLAQVPESSSQAAVSIMGLDGFGGFAAGRSSSGGGAGSAPLPSVSSLASAAADRLLLAQQAGRLSSGSMGGGGENMLAATGQQGVGVDTETAREARLTLLRAWVNASAAAARGALRSADGSLAQQEQQLLQASVDGGMNRVARLGSNGVAAVAQDLASVLSPGDVLLLVQQLHGMLSN